MPIVYPDILELNTPPQRFSWSKKDTMLYALGLGLGSDPLDERELQFVYEKNLNTLPTFATIVARGATPPIEKMVNMLLTVHGEQALTMHCAMPSEGEVIAEGKILEVHDKGLGKGAVIYAETKLSLPSGQPLATLTRSSFSRGDGGFGGPHGSNRKPHDTPTRKPDLVYEIRTRRDQALIYRLSGDYNPLHADPDAAIRAGYPRPILHGLCTYGLAMRAITATFASFKPAAVEHLEARFSAPVFPGETISFRLWKDAQDVSFEGYIAERDAVVLKNGCARLAHSMPKPS